MMFFFCFFFSFLFFFILFYFIFKLYIIVLVLGKSGNYSCVKTNKCVVLTKMLSEKMASFLDTSSSLIGHDFMYYVVHLQ